MAESCGEKRGRVDEALWQAATLALRLAGADRSILAGADSEPAGLAEKLARRALRNHSEDLEKIAVAMEDIADGVPCEHCAWLARFYQTHEPRVWAYIIELLGGQRLLVRDEEGRAIPWRKKRDAVEEYRYLGGIGVMGRNLIRWIRGWRHLQGRKLFEDDKSRRDKLDEAIRTHRPPNWQISVQLSSADREPARAFIEHVRDRGLRQIMDDLSAAYLTLPHPEDRWIERPILAQQPVRDALAVARRRRRDVSANFTHKFLAVLLETTPNVIRTQLEKDPSSYPQLPSVEINIDLDRQS